MTENNEKFNGHYFQQGDVLLKRIGLFGVFEKEFSQIPSDAKKIQGNLVLKGVLNSHAFYGGEFEIFEKDGTRFFRVIKETTLDHVKDHLNGREHAEHHAQTIPVGEYFLGQVMEYDHLKEESRAIID